MAGVELLWGRNFSNINNKIFQNEIKEVIWLELQAWFSGNTVNIQDQWILHQRKLVDQVLYMVGNYQLGFSCKNIVLKMLFRFVPNDETQEQDIFNQLSTESSNSHGQDVFYDAQVGIIGSYFSL